MMMTRLTSIAFLAMLAAGGCTGKYIRPTTQESVDPSPDKVARGSYLVNQVTMCTVCHTPRVGGNWLGGERTDAFLSGGAVFNDLEMGFKMVTPNITQDRETGIGAWTDDEIMRAIRDGVHRENRLMMPPMPFFGFGVMSDEDVRCIVAYLRTVPPLKNKIDREKNHFPFLAKVAASLGLMHHTPARDVKAPPPADKKARGEYLARIGACWECHSLSKTGPSDSNLMGGSKMVFAEPEYGKVYARNLTPDKETGLGNFTPDQIKQALKTGKRLDGKVMSLPMSLMIPHLSTWEEEDLDALVTFLTSIPPIKHKVPERELTAEAKKLAGE